MRHQPPSYLVLPCSLLFLIISFHSSFSSSTPKNSLYRGSSLSVEDDSDFLTSPDKSFTCGFYRVGKNTYSFSIWFTNSANKTVVWMANRDRPVNGKGSRLSLRSDGIMVLTDLDGSTVWSANTNTNKTVVDRAEILNTGNLVLKDPSGKILWQSFDSPTDTLLPSQFFSKNTKLISSKGKGTYFPGYYSFFFDNDNVLRLIYDGPEITSVYWPNPEWDVIQNGRTTYNSSRFAVLDDMGKFIASDKMQFSAFDMGVGIKRRLTMDYDGNLRLYSLNQSTGSWVITWEALSELCKVHGLCGRNGICIYTPKPKCSCPPGYEMSDPRDWNKGCKRMFNLTHDQPQQIKFLVLPQTDFYGYDVDYFPYVPLEYCIKVCLGNRSCEAFGYRATGEGIFKKNKRTTGRGECFPKIALFNGYKSPNFPGTIYLKVPKSMEVSESSTSNGSDPTCGANEEKVVLGSPDMYNTQRGKMKWVHFYWFISVMGAIEVFFIVSGWWFLFGRHGLPNSVENGYRAISSQFRRFTFAELKKATKNFREELGRGGSGAVYKGVLGDERVVAVKKLGDVIRGEEEFWAEVSTIGRINHMNLVRMWGFCSEKAHRLLVYEYVENGSLGKYLFSNAWSSSRASLLEWKNRFRIALGTAKGLAYLHHECLEWVIHCDVKPENILLDSDFEPKIADFGLAKLSQRGGSGYDFSRIRGTKGYMAPEWALNHPITAKVDVYSYGVVLLEIVKGIRLSSLAVAAVAVDCEEEAELRRSLSAVKKKIENGEDLMVEYIVDPRLKGQFNRNQAAVMLEIGIACVDEDRSKRPTMDAVVQALLECEDRDEPEFHGVDML